MKNWNIVPCSDTEEDADWRILREALAERVERLLTRNTEKLLAALYLLDIPEHRYHEAMGQPTLGDQASALAQIILEQESEKIEMRKKYGGSARPQIESDGGPGGGGNLPV